MTLNSLVDSKRDALYHFSAEDHKALVDAKPWRSDPHYFKYVRISAVALVKMVMHARSGGDIEVMGLMLGHVEHETFIISDAVRLPVEGTETRVNAQDEANEYIVKFLERSRQNGQLENAVGWYHSHPGYGCWLSGIDVATQELQQALDPFVAVVIDPHRTVSAGKVEIGAFRTHPKDNSSDVSGSILEKTGPVPENKAQDFGAHAERYYSLEVSHFKSTLDSKLLEALWNKYWVQTLSSSPLNTNQDYVTNQVKDLAAKIEFVQEPSRRLAMGYARKGPSREEEMANVIKSAEKIANEERAGLVAAVAKERIFTTGATTTTTSEQIAHDTNVPDTQMSDAKPN